MEVREEVLNVILAELISKRGLISIPETVIRSVRSGRKLPDITIANLFGVSVVIEGKIGSVGVVQDALAEQAMKRVEDGITPLCIAVIYPTHIKTIDSLEELKAKLETTDLTVAAFSINNLPDWTTQNIDGLTGLLRRSYELLISEDEVVQSVNEIEKIIEFCAEGMASVPSLPERIRQVVGIPPERLKEPDGIMKTTRIAALALINACIFHQIIAERDPRIRTMGQIVSERYIGEALADDWEKILTQIDYVPIFNLANELIKRIRGMSRAEPRLKYVCNVASHIANKKTALKHDLMGRIYHRLLADAKYFGAFYTSVNAATLLTSLAFESLTDTIDWSDLTSIENLRMGDLACGTGTLLKTVLHEIEDNYVRSAARKNKEIDLESLHRRVLQESLWGFDVVPFAIHLAASTLAIHNPEVLFDTLRLYTMPLGITQNESLLGSLDFLTNRSLGVQADLLGAASAPGRITGEGELSQAVELPLLDLCIMNPPFTRSVGGNLLFGNAPEDERNRMQTKLKQIVNRNHVNANITAGLASVFVALGVKLTKSSGVLALVLPRALLTGVAWEVTRDLIARNFYVRYIVVSHEPGQWSFSESTNLSECLIVAERIKSNDSLRPTKFVNLWAKPRNSIEALAISDIIKHSTGSNLEDDLGTQELLLENTKFGEIITRTVHDKQLNDWGLGVAFAQTELCRVVCNLFQGRLYIPSLGPIGDVPLIRLGDLGELGPDARDIHDGYRKSENYTAYQAIWGHNTETIRCIAQDSNTYLTPLPQALPRRSLRNPIDLWAKAGRFLLVERLRLTTARAIGLVASVPVLSTSWWPFSPHERDIEAAGEIEKILALWLNSTLGVLLMIASRVETEGSWIKCKKPNLLSMLVLNPAKLNPDQKKQMMKTFDEFSKAELQRLPDIASDNVRARIDAAILETIGLNADMRILREMLSLEPSISGKLPVHQTRPERTR